MVATRPTAKNRPPSAANRCQRAPTTGSLTGRLSSKGNLAPGGAEILRGVRRGAALARHGQSNPVCSERDVEQLRLPAQDGGERDAWLDPAARRPIRPVGDPEAGSGALEGLAERRVVAPADDGGEQS